VIDEGVVFSVEERSSLAQVTVEPSEACCSCSARHVCGGGGETKGRLTVLNPLRARPGDVVRIEIPDDRYSGQAVFLFGGLLLAAAAGLGLGILASAIFSLPDGEAGFLGFVIGLVAGGFAVYRRFQSGRRQPPYPVITDILRQGDAHGSS